jgi:uncharacterized protein YegP (UPF0339 family)
MAATYFDVYRDANREWRWRLVAANGEPIAASGEGYVRRVDALAAVRMVNGAGDVPILIRRTPEEEHDA